jgi:DNA-binding transcriptional LysR family regulator
MAVFYQVEVFRAVMKTGTMTAAASLLHITQPSVTKHIQALEARLNAKLFVKDGRAVRPTAVALQLHDEAEIMFSLGSNIERIVDSFSGATKRSIRVGIPPVLSSKFLVEIIDRVGIDRSEYQLNAVVKDTRLLKGMISYGLLDVAVFGEHVHEAGTDYGRNPLVCVMQAGHPLANQPSVTLADLSNHAYISHEKESPIRLAIEAAAREANVRIIPRTVVSTTPMLLDLVAHGIGVGIVHPFAILAAQVGVVVRRFEPQIMWEYKVVQSKTMRNSSIVGAFVNAIGEVSSDWVARSTKLSDPSLTAAAGKLDSDAFIARTRSSMSTGFA